MAEHDRAGQVAADCGHDMPGERAPAGSVQPVTSTWPAGKRDSRRSAGGSLLFVILVAVVVVLAVNPSTQSWALVVVVTSSAVAVGRWDVRSRRIPNAFVAATAAGGAIVACGAAATDQLAGFAGFAAGGVVAGVPLLVVHLVSPRGIGFGDVKYSFALGACLGVIDWRLAVLTVLVASIVGPIVAIVWRPWRRSIPLGLLLGGAGAALLIAEVAQT